MSCVRYSAPGVAGSQFAAEAGWLEARWALRGRQVVNARSGVHSPVAASTTIERFRLLTAAPRLVLLRHQTLRVDKRLRSTLNAASTAIFEKRAAGSAGRYDFKSSTTNTSAESPLYAGAASAGLAAMSARPSSESGNGERSNRISFGTVFASNEISIGTSRDFKPQNCTNVGSLPFSRSAPIASWLSRRIDRMPDSDAMPTPTRK